MGKANSAITVILFYVGWFGSVLSAQTAHSWQAIAFPIALISFLYLKKLLNNKIILTALFITMLGITFDSLLARLELITIPGQTTLIIPVWLISIWLLFSFSMMKLGVSFNLPIWALACLGFVFGPLSYKSGEVFNALFIASNLALFSYAVFWAIFFPTVILLSKRFS